MGVKFLQLYVDESHVKKKKTCYIQVRDKIIVYLFFFAIHIQLFMNDSNSGKN